MAYIRVNHAQFQKASNSIETYIQRQKKNMSKIDQAVVGLEAHWKGADYEQVKKEWNQMNSSDSTSDKMIKSLQNYADALDAAAKKYKDAQSRAINRANTFCK